MTAALMLTLTFTMLGTAFLSGIFGMAGGLILMGVLLWLLPVAEAMSLHAVTQIASNGWRGILWIAHVRWRPAAMFLAGCAIAFVAWSQLRYLPSKPVAYILLGLSPFLVRMAPRNLKPDPERLAHGVAYGAASMSLMLLAGVSGPLIDTYFLGGTLDRRQIVATKSVCQIACHGAKLAYFSTLVEQAAGLDPVMAGLAVAASMAGTTLARPILERLSDTQYRQWATHIITAVAAVFLLQGGVMLWR